MRFFQNLGFIILTPLQKSDHLILRVEYLRLCGTCRTATYIVRFYISSAFHRKLFDQNRSKNKGATAGIKTAPKIENGKRSACASQAVPTFSAFWIRNFQSPSQKPRLLLHLLSDFGKISLVRRLMSYGF